jgi:hypothetical protein
MTADNKVKLFAGKSGQDKMWSYKELKLYTVQEFKQKAIQLT